jgi:hypothetical protein
MSDSAAAPTIVRAAAPNDWRERAAAGLAAAVLAAAELDAALLADAVLADAVLAAAVLAAAVLLAATVAPMPQATAAANATTAVSTTARRVCLGAPAAVCSGLLTQAMLPTPSPHIKGSLPQMGRAPHLGLIRLTAGTASAYGPDSRDSTEAGKTGWACC